MCSFDLFMAAGIVNSLSNASWVCILEPFDIAYFIVGQQDRLQPYALLSPFPFPLPSSH